MPHSPAAIRSVDRDRSTLGRDALMATFLALVVLLPAVFDGSVTQWRADNDSMMRIVQVRDLLAGQGWFDASQYRMGLEGGFVMHWSRIVDLPIATIILIAQAVTGSSAAGEWAAGLIWPSVLLMLAILAIMQTARTLGGEQALFPAALIATMSLYSIGIYAPGAFDHHNIQLTLCLLALWAMAGGLTVRQGLAAGSAIALSLATGMETLPLVAAAGAAVALAFLIAGPSFSVFAAGFGIGLASISAAAFVSTVGPQNWFAVYCDAYSIAQLSLAMAGGIGLAIIAGSTLANGGILSRGAGLGGLAVLIAALVIIAYPQCLADPYAGLDQRLKIYWLSGIGEAQSVTSIWLNDPVTFAKYYATPLAAMAVSIAALSRTGPHRGPAFVAALLFSAIIVSFWQVRGGNFAVAIAAIPLAIWVGEWRARASAQKSSRATVAMVAAWVVSLNACWTLAAQAVQNTANPPQVRSNPAGLASNRGCYRENVFDQLANLEPGTVAAVSNIGSAILKYTPHHVLAGPYHRNIAGNMANLDILMGADRDAYAAAKRHGVTIIAHCPGDDETGVLARAAPDGLLEALNNGSPPSWLVRLEIAEHAPLVLYRVIVK